MCEDYAIFPVLKNKIKDGGGWVATISDVIVVTKTKAKSKASVNL